MLLYFYCVENKKVSVLLEMADDNDGYVSVADATRFGIAQSFISDLVEQGLFNRVAKGLYIKKGYEVDPYYLLHYTYKKATFGYETSLFLQGIEAAKDPIEIYLPSNYMTSGIENTRCRHLGKKEYETGLILLVTPKGNLVPGYDLERLFIDTLRRKNELDKAGLLSRLKEIANKGLYKERLFAYAKSFHVKGEVELALKIL